MSATDYPVEIRPPDIAPHRDGNTGVPYVTTLDSGAPGPHAMVSAVVHGNELCGAIVLDELLRDGVRPRRGRLTLAFMNVAAFSRFDPAQPGASRYVDEDFNRLWSEEVLDGPRGSAELERAREVRRIVDEADYLLDLHSMQHPTPALTLCGPTAKGRALALALGAPAYVVADEGHAAGRRMRDYGAFADEASPRNALLVECGQHWARETVATAREVTLRFLRHLELLPADYVEPRLAGTEAPAQRVIEVAGPVTIASDRFRFAAPYRGLEVIERAGTLIGWDGDTEIRTPFDDCVLIMPSRRLRRGETAVRLGRYVD